MMFAFRNIRQAIGAGLWAFILFSIFAVPAIAQDGSNIGKRMYNDERVPESTVNNKVILRKKYAPRKVEPKTTEQEQPSVMEEPQSNTVQENTAPQTQQSESENQQADGNALPVSEEDARAPRNRKALRELETLTPEEQEEIARRLRGDDDEDAEIEDDDEDEVDVDDAGYSREQRREIDNMNNQACKRVCEMTDGENCFEKCMDAGICATGFVDCESR